jgi:hypothetical protein
MTPVLVLLLKLNPADSSHTEYHKMVDLPQSGKEDNQKVEEDLALDLN